MWTAPVAAALTCMVVLSTSPVRAAEPQRPPVVRYAIEASLAADLKVIRARQTILWRNTTNAAVDRIPLHLYMNAFRPGSTFEVESGGRHRGVARGDDGRIELHTLLVRDADHLPRARYIQPDDDNASDRTLLEIPLDPAVQPGEEIRLGMSYTVHLPRVFARTGWADDFVLAGQWYPKPAVLEEAGVRGRPSAGWNLHQYHAKSEYYADFADFDVTITTPADHIVGATGELVSSVPGDGVQTTRWRAKNVHDFAWTSSSTFVEREYIFNPAEDVPKDLVSESIRLLGDTKIMAAVRPVRVRFLMQPANLSQLDRYRDAVFATLAWCSLRFGPYPYGVLTIVDPPPDARGAGGMEYPMLVTGLSDPAADIWPLSRMLHETEAVLVHEVAHQYWYGLVASNEFEESWLDEGLTSWTEQEVMDRLFPAGKLSMPFLPGLTTLALNRFSFLQSRDWDTDPIVRDSWRYAPGGYDLNSYREAALAISQIEGITGEKGFARGLREYFRRWSFRHPGTADFFEVMQEVTEVDLTSIRRSVFYGSGGFDHSVRHAQTWGAQRWTSTVEVVRTGRVQVPAVVELRFRDGSTQRALFPAEARWARFRSETGAPLVAVVIDPEWKNVLEQDRRNNVRRPATGMPRLSAAALTGASWAARLVRLMSPGW